METVGYAFYHRSEGKIFVAILAREGASLELESSSSLKSVPVIPTPISEEVNDDDHETSD